MKRFHDSLCPAHSAARFIAAIFIATGILRPVAAQTRREMANATATPTTKKTTTAPPIIYLDRTISLPTKTVYRERPAIINRLRNADFVWNNKNALYKFAASMIEHRSDFDAQIFRCFERASDLGSAKAAKVIAENYIYAVFDKPDYGNAMKWYAQAANLGDPESSRKIAGFYADGEGIKQDSAQALLWYKRAAALNDTTSIMALASAYDDGKGVKKDYTQATLWYERAISLGYTDAMVDMASLKGKLGTKQGNIEAIKYLRKAAEAGNVWAMVDLGMKYESVGNDALAKPWYEKAIELGNRPGRPGGDVDAADAAKDRLKSLSAF